MYKTLSRGDLDLLLRCLDYSKQNISDQPIDPDMPEKLRDDQRAMQKENLARIETLINKLRFMRDTSD